MEAELGSAKKPKINLEIIMPTIKKRNTEWLVQKLTELGASSILFINSEYEGANKIMKSRLKSITENACMQSGNLFMPSIEFSGQMVFDLIYKEDVSYFWGNVTNGPSTNLNNIDFQNLNSISFLNGPEGGWSAKESQFLKNRFPSIRLSDNVMRSETAAICFVSIFKALSI